MKWMRTCMYAKLNNSTSPRLKTKFIMQELQNVGKTHKNARKQYVRCKNVKLNIRNVYITFWKVYMPP